MGKDNTEYDYSSAAELIMGIANCCSDSDEPIWRDRTSDIPAEKEGF